MLPSDSEYENVFLQYASSELKDGLITTARQGQGAVYNPRKSEKVATFGSVGGKPLGLRGVCAGIDGVSLFGGWRALGRGIYLEEQFGVGRCVDWDLDLVVFNVLWMGAVFGM